MGRRRRRPAEPAEVTISRLSHEGRGVASIDGKVAFVDDALPDETLRVRVVRSRRRYDEAVVEEVLSPSPQRIEPRCAVYGTCGGCSLQHMDGDAQRAHKQSVLEELLRRETGTPVPEVLAPLQGPEWGYRHKARLAVKHVPKKGGVLVGFRERHAPYVVEMSACEVLVPQVSALIPRLRELIGGLSIPDRIPQIEVAAADNATALVFRHLQPLTDADLVRLREFARSSDMDVYLQSQGPDSVAYLDGPGQGSGTLHYGLPEQQVEISFLPTDFTQVNPELNRRMVGHVLELLAPSADDKVADLFCGVGNFSLPLARAAGEVVGVEGDQDLVARARANAERNGIGNARFQCADLTTDLDIARQAMQDSRRVLFDPPRTGARELVEGLDFSGVEKLVYVSCNPATLARDAGLLGQRGLTLKAAGIMDMFPHTAHVESVAVFEAA